MEIVEDFKTIASVNLMEDRGRFKTIVKVQSKDIIFHHPRRKLVDLVYTLCLFCSVLFISR